MANEEVLRLRTTIVSEESLANIRAIGREIGVNLPAHGKRGAKEIETGFKRVTETVKGFGEQVLKAIPGLEEFGLGAAGAGAAVAVLGVTLTRISGKIVELQYASKELGMTERDLKGWSLAAEKAGIAPAAMIANLKSFRDVSQGFKYNIGGVRDELVSMGAGPVVARIMAARTETDKLKQAFNFKDALMKADPSGYQARKFFEMIGLGAEAARLSFDEFEKSREKFKPLTPEEIERAKKFHDAIKDLGAAWDELLEKTGIEMFPALTAGIKKLDWLLGKIEAIDHAWDHFARGPSGKGTVLGKIIPGYDEQPNLNPRVGGGRPRAPTAPVPEGDALKNFVHPQNVNPRSGYRPPTAPTAPEHHSALQSGFKPVAFSERLDTGGGNLSEFSKAVKDGVFAALVDFKSYVETGGAAAGGGFTAASFGGSAGAAAGGGVPSGGGGFHSGGGYTVQPEGGGGGGGGGGRRGGGGGGGGDGGPGSEGSTTPPSGNLAAQRAGFMKELNADPKLKSFAIDAMQHEGGIQSNMEQLFNYAAMRHMTIRQALHSGQYGPVNRGLISGNISEKTRRAGEAAVQAVGAGSNITDYATDQGMAGDPNYAKYMANRERYHMHKVEGAWFSAHGERGRQWAEQQRARDAAKSTADRDFRHSEDIEDRRNEVHPTGFQRARLGQMARMNLNEKARRAFGDQRWLTDPLAPPSELAKGLGADRLDQQLGGGNMTATGNVNVNITSNGTAARASADTKGSLWADTTIRNYKQMQPTNAPSPPISN